MLGGAAANTGTLPSKTRRESAPCLSGFRPRGRYGITLSLKDKVPARAVRRAGRTGSHRGKPQAPQVDLHSGFAAFEDAHTVSITPPHLPPAFIKGDNLLIATGPHPHHPPNLPFHNSRVCDSETVLNSHDIPPTMLIAVGGVIGCEYACMFAALGIKVSLVDARESVTEGDPFCVQ